MKHARRVRAALVLGPFLGAVLIPLACTSEPTLVGAGEECFVASDCAPGLVCVPQRGGARICSNDLTQVVGRPPPEAGGADVTEGGEGGEAGGDAMPAEAGQDASIPDTSMPDTSKPADAAADG